ncbi:MAG: GGDEF domain-containing protein [Candidatus Micrarchaeia archaeon]|jgi:diguanylate cyclase (GGDEF)-like protein
MKEPAEMLSTLQALKKALETSPEDALLELLGMVVKTANASSARLWIEDSNNREFIRCIASLPLDHIKWKKIKKLRIKKSLKFIKDSLDNPGIVQEKIITDNLRTKDLYADLTNQKGLNLICGVELGGRRNCGLIAIDFIDKNPNKSEIKLAKSALETSATLIGLLFTNEDWLQNLEQLSKIDELTGLYNIREYNIQLSKEMENLKLNKTKKYLFLAEFDIDDFKKINDKFESHIIGDKVLERIGKRIIEFIEINTLINIKAYRRGGDEFAILIADKSRVESRKIIEQLFKKIAKPVKIKYKKREISIPLTISLGCGMFEDRFSIQDFRNTIDARVYFAKKTGKNKIIGKKEHLISSF